MENVVAIGNSHNLYRLSKNFSPQKRDASEVITEYDHTLIHTQEHRFACCTEHQEVV